MVRGLLADPSWRFGLEVAAPNLKPHGAGSHQSTVQRCRAPPRVDLAAAAGSLCVSIGVCDHTSFFVRCVGYGNTDGGVG